MPGRPSRLETIPLASADPDDLTLGAARLLGEADHVFHAAAVPAAILDRARADAVRHLADAPPVDPPPRADALARHAEDRLGARRAQLKRALDSDQIGRAHV